MKISITFFSRIHALAFLSVVLALIATVLPLPHWAIPFWPDWLILVIIYWCVAAPENFNLGFAWVAGLFMDLVRGALLGQYALAYLLIAYICIHIHRRLRVSPLPQQVLWVGALLFLYTILCMAINGTYSSASIDWRHFMPIVTSMLLWPWVFSILRLAMQKTRKPRGKLD